MVPGKPRQQVMAEKILQQSREAENALADALVSLPPSLVVSTVTLRLTLLMCAFVSYLKY